MIVGSAEGFYGIGVTRIIKKRIQYTNFNTASSTVAFDAGSLDIYDDHILLDVFVKVVTTFSGGSASNVTLDASYVTTQNDWLDRADMFSGTGWQGTSNAEKGSALDAAETAIAASSANLHCYLRVTGDTADNLTQGDATVYMIVLEPGDPIS
jgi:hypothetical protein